MTASATRPRYLMDQSILIAATAVRHDAVVVHNDTDFLTLQRAVPELDQLRIVLSSPDNAGTST